MRPADWKPLGLAAVFIAIGAQIAVNALSYLAGAWSGKADGLVSISGAMFAPFALVALFLPVVAGPLAKRLIPTPESASTIPMVLAFVGVVVLAELGTAVARSLAGLPALESPKALHGLIAIYAALGAYLFCRRAPHVESPNPEP
jgi:hypothetical protein